MPSYDNATGAQALALKLHNVSNPEIESITEIQPATLHALYKKALSKGLKPTESQRILDHYVEDGKRSNKPTKQTTEIIEDVISKVRRNRYGKEKTCAQIALELKNVSDITV
jgi:hypothetical protein